jgi:hypothetical protein
MHLDGQRLVGREHLEQERQPAAEPARDRRAQFLLRVAGDDGVQRGRHAVAVQAGRQGRVRAHP